MRTSVQWWNDSIICILHQNIAYPLSNNKEGMNKAGKYSTYSKVWIQNALKSNFMHFFSIILLLQQRIMSQCRPLCKISDNRPIGHELTINEWAQIVSTVKCGVRMADITRTLNFILKTIQTTVQRDSMRYTNEALPWSGCLKKATERDICTIIWYV